MNVLEAIGGIYKITSPSNLVYIGQSVNINRRFLKYKSNINNSTCQTKLNRSFLKYGIENHKFEIIEKCAISELNNKERYYQDFYNSINNGLNLTLTHCETKSGHLSEETKLKISKTRKEKNLKFTEESIKKSIISKKNKYNNDPSYKERLSKAQLGKKLTLETKLKISEALKNRIRHKESYEKAAQKTRKVILQINNNNEIVNIHNSIKEASEAIKCSKSSIINCLKGRCKTSSGYKWEYKI
jgi:group I intron endonuclease